MQAAATARTVRAAQRMGFPPRRRERGAAPARLPVCWRVAGVSRETAGAAAGSARLYTGPCWEGPSGTQFHGDESMRALSIAAIGLAAVLGGCATTGEKEKEHETVVTMDQLPAPVKATLEKESAGGKVIENEKETKDGKTVYSADVMIKDQKWDIMIGEDGKVVSKEKD